MVNVGPVGLVNKEDNVVVQPEPSVTINEYEPAFNAE